MDQMQIILWNRYSLYNILLFIRYLIYYLLQGNFFGEIRDRNESRRNRPSTSNRLRSGGDTPIREDGFGGQIGNDDIGNLE